MADLFDIVVARKLSGGGGGGSSDFSTAQVTLVNSTAESLDISLLPTYAVEEGMGCTICTLGDQLSSNTSVTIPIVLYKGGCIWATYSVDAYADYTFTGTGSVSMDLGMPFITGDCTITIS